MAKIEETEREELVGLLTKQGLRITEQRLMVLAAMRREPNDVTAQSLHKRLRKANPKLGQATVYRTLTVLADGGVLDRINHLHGATCYRFCAPGHHHHLTCRECHRVVELRNCDLGNWAENVGDEHGFSGVSHNVELEGTCADCVDGQKTGHHHDTDLAASGPTSCKHEAIER